jgi:hypothetical protein
MVHNGGIPAGFAQHHPANAPAVDQHWASALVDRRPAGRRTTRRKDSD